MAVPTLSVRYSTDDASDATPTWVDVTSYVRSFSTSRGRESELARVDPGTATLVLNNRTRRWDPTENAALRPMNRWNIRATLPNGTTEDVFLGYAESYEQQWPGVGMDAVTVVRAVDEFKILAQDRLPVTDPPRDTYADVVAYDDPQGYWRWGTNPGSTNALVSQPAIGNSPLGVKGSGTVTFNIPPAIVGEQDASDHRSTSTTVSWASWDESAGFFGLAAGGPGDAASLSNMTFETWFKSSEATPASARTIATGPASSGNAQWGLTHNTDGSVSAYARGSGTLYTTGSSAVLAADTWYHLAVVVSSSSTLLYVNGVLAASAGFGGSFGTMDASEFMYIGTLTAIGGTRYYDEAAYYRTGLAADRILAHYNAGALRGFPTQDPGARITAIVSESSSVATTSIRAGSREMTAAFMAGQSPLEMIRNAESADAVDAVVFIARDGTITFLDDGHRSVSPWNTVQATFDDDGTDLPYQDINLDYSDSFIANEWNVTRTGGTTTTTTDATSTSRYGKRSQSLSDLAITTSSDQDAIAAAMLAKYKDPITRITGLGLLATGTAAFINTIFTLDIGARIRALRSPLGAATRVYPDTSLFPATTLYPEADRIDQTLFVQRIQVDADPGGPWQMTLGVSPL